MKDIKLAHSLILSAPQILKPKALALLAGVCMFPVIAVAHDANLAPYLDAIEKKSETILPTNDADADFSIGQYLLNAFVSPVNASGNAAISTKGGYRYIRSNGIPDHVTGAFPNSGNPNRISAQRYNFRVPINPVKNAKFTQSGRKMFGVAVNGIPIDPGTAETYNRNPRSPWREEAISASGKGLLGLDKNNAHVQPNGAYHYHGVPDGLLSSLSKFGLIGYAADGFPIYYTGQKSSYALKNGMRPKGSGSPGGKYDGKYGKDYAFVGGTLDRCNGTTGKTPEYGEGTYYYVVTSNYPWFPRCFAGTPDTSFNKKGGPGARRRPPGAGAGLKPRPPRRNEQAQLGQRRPPPRAAQSADQRPPPRPGFGQRRLRPGFGPPPPRRQP